MIPERGTTPGRTPRVVTTTLDAHSCPSASEVVTADRTPHSLDIADLTIYRHSAGGQKIRRAGARAALRDVLEEALAGLEGRKPLADAIAGAHQALLPAVREAMVAPFDEWTESAQ